MKQWKWIKNQEFSLLSFKKLHSTICFFLRTIGDKCLILDWKLFKLFTIFPLRIKQFKPFQKYLFIRCFRLYRVEQTTYSYNGNEETKFAAAIVYVSAMLTYPKIAGSILNEIVRRTYLNESFLRKFGQSIHEFYLDCPWEVVKTICREKIRNEISVNNELYIFFDIELNFWFKITFFTIVHMQKNETVWYVLFSFWNE